MLTTEDEETDDDDNDNDEAEEEESKALARGGGEGDDDGTIAPDIVVDDESGDVVTPFCCFSFSILSTR